jgi:hypothetical protein
MSLTIRRNHRSERVKRLRGGARCRHFRRRTSPAPAGATRGRLPRRQLLKSASPVSSGTQSIDTKSSRYGRMYVLLLFFPGTLNCY